MAVIYQGKDISESSESTPDSSSSEDVKETAVRRKYAKTHKPKEHREFCKQVYCSNEESFRDEYLASFKIKQLNKRHWLIHLRSSLKKIQVVAINLRALVMKLCYQMTLMVMVMMCIPKICSFHCIFC